MGNSIRWWLIGIVIGAAFWMGGAAPLAAAPGRMIYTDPAAPLETRVADLLKRLTQREKFSLLALDSHADPSQLNTPPIPRLNVPSLRTCDAPEGVKDGQSSVFPMGVVLASTWDPALMGQVGAAIGQEARAKDRQVIYGPCVNIARTPLGGRDFESFGEDPYLASRMAVGYIQGMQSQGVAACVKHFACNNQQVGQHDIDVRVGERALREIYLPAFQAAVQQGHVWTLMDSFNRINGTFMAQNRLLLHDLVKTEWGWDGLVISDWAAMHDTVDAANGGTDVEMPQPAAYSPGALAGALQRGQITQATVDDMVRRVLRTMVRTGRLDPPKATDPAVVNSAAHQRLALKAAQEGVTLLKNTNGLLPLNRAKVKSIAVIGPNAQDTQLGGRWSADVQPVYSVSVLAGIQKRAGAGVTVKFAQGCPRNGTGSPADLQAAVDLARRFDVAVVVVGFDNNYEGEELDPPDLYLTGDQDKLIQAVAAANPNTVVVLNQGTPILMDKWLGRVPGLVESWYAGQEQGNAVAGVLFGDVNPSGKLPITLGARREDYSDYPNYPGSGGIVKYTEGIYVGYRHFDRAKIAPLFPFGFGLSYTRFGYGGLHVSPTLAPGGTATVRLTVRNTGLRTGAEVVQLYVHDLAPKVDRPIQELKGFQRVMLLPGHTATVAFGLDVTAFRYWDLGAHRWKADPGRYEIEVGSSSRDIRLHGVLRLQ